MPDKKFELSPSISILIAGVIIAGAVVFTNRGGAAASADVAAANGALPAPTELSIRPPTEQDHIVGSPSAPIVLVEFSDYQCPFCTMVHPTLKKIVADSNGQISWVMRQLPLTSIHPQAEPAAHAAECIAALAGNAAYWKFTDEVFANQQKLSPEYYAQLAGQLGADPGKYAQCVSTRQYQSKIDADMNEAMQNGGNGTPFTVIYNTKTGKMVPVSGALPEAQFLRAIESIK